MGPATGPPKASAAGPSNASLKASLKPVAAKHLVVHRKEKVPDPNAAESFLRSIADDMGITYDVLPIPNVTIHSATPHAAPEVRSVFVHIWARARLHSLPSKHERPRLIVEGFYFVADASLPLYMKDHIMQPHYVERWQPSVLVYTSMTLRDIPVRAVHHANMTKGWDLLRPINFEADVNATSTLDPCVTVRACIRCCACAFALGVRCAHSISGALAAAQGPLRAALVAKRWACFMFPIWMETAK